eukprot:1116659-Rhodomonas_salina.3
MLGVTGFETSGQRARAQTIWLWFIWWWFGACAVESRMYCVRASSFRTHERLCSGLTGPVQPLGLASGAVGCVRGSDVVCSSLARSLLLLPISANYIEEQKKGVYPRTLFNT